MTPLADMDERKEPKSRLDVWKSCGSCKKDFKDDIPKLLPCLHTFCEPCLKANTADDTQQVKCPECQLSCTLDNVINNMFIMESKMSSEKHTSTGEENKFICTACEENQTASSFCKDCGEWLCDQCVQAHKRVRVTKDHTVVPKEDAMQNDSLSNNQKTVYCKLHRQEPLKLFCETCDKVTCRDCQLLEHKEHKYQFVHEASAKQKQLLAQLLAKVKEKQSHIQSAKSLLNNRHEEIHTREQQVIHEIKSLGEKITREVMRRLKTIAGDLEAVCANKRNQLLRVEAQIMALEEKTNHCQAFVEEAINSGTNLSLLYTKNFMRNNLKNALSSTLQVPNPNHIVDIRFSFNTDGVMNALKTLGSLHIDGAPYGSSTTSSPALTPVINGMPNTVQNAQVSQTAVQAFSNQLSVMNQNQRSRLIQAMVEFRKKQGTNNLFPLPQQVPQNRHPPQNVQVTPVPPPPPMGSPPVRHMAPNGPVLHPHQQNLVKTNSVYYPPSGVPPGQYPRYMNLNQLQQSHLVQQQQQQQQQMMHHGSTVLHRPPVAAPRLPPPPLYPINSTVRTVASSNIPPTQLSHSSKELLDSTASRSLTSGGPSPGIAQSDLSSHSWPEVSHKNITPSPPRPASSGSAVSNRVNKDKIDGCMLIEPVKVKREKNGTSCCNETVKHSTDADANQNLEQAINNLPLDSSELIPEQLYPNTVSDNFISWKCMDDLGDDPNEDYCACCHNGGDLLCCDSCPKVFHLQCHIPALVSAPSCGAWNCTFCEDPGVIEEQRIKEFIVAGGTKRKAPTGLSEKELKVCERLLLELFCHSASTPFHEPVSKAVPNYYKIIVRPMDFTTVKCKLSRQHFNHYNEIEDFMIDIKLVFHNCAIYNSLWKKPHQPNMEVSEVGQAGKVVEKFFHELIKKYLPCYVDFLQGIDFNTSDSADMPLAKQKKTDEISP